VNQWKIHHSIKNPFIRPTFQYSPFVASMNASSFERILRLNASSCRVQAGRSKIERLRDYQVVSKINGLMKTEKLFLIKRVSISSFDKTFVEASKTR
jgi:hypothetical protein